MIIFRENLNRLMIPFEGQIPLASFNEPQAQAVAWACAQSACTFDSQIILLGLGAGFHLRELRNITQQDIFVLENRVELISTYQKNKVPNTEVIYLENVEFFVDQFIRDLSFADLNMSSVLHFAPCFGEQKDFFQNLYGLLTGRTFYGLEFHFVMQKWLKKSNAYFSEKIHHWRDLDQMLDHEKVDSKSYHLLKAVQEVAT